MLNESEKEKVRTFAVELLLEMRVAYLRTPGANALKNWDFLTSRMRSAARTSSSVEEWATDMARGLKTEAPSVNYSQALIALADRVREKGAANDFLSLIESEWGYLIALARSIAEQRKEAKNV